MLPRFPSSDEHDPPPSPEARDLATFSALFVLAGLGVGLLFLIGMVLPQALYLALIVVGFGLYFCLHYLVWGRLMSSLTSEESDQEAAWNVPLPPPDSLFRETALRPQERESD